MSVAGGLWAFRVCNAVRLRCFAKQDKAGLSKRLDAVGGCGGVKLCGSCVGAVVVYAVRC